MLGYNISLCLGYRVTRWKDWKEEAESTLK